MVRVTPEVHRQLAIDAAEQHVSLNRLAASRLVGT
ncbi:toxin-antitoxin system HicB family antitoxin [Microbacterium aerolatum]|jgi:predicted HicB family RNase H-like nuclease